MSGLWNDVTRAVLLTLVLGGSAVSVGPSWGQEEKPPSTPSREALDFFESKIRPVLVTHCYECHSANAKIVQGGLRVDSRAGIVRGGDSGSAVDLAKPSASLLLRALRYDSLEMPPKGRLPASVARDFETWIELGMPDPRAESVVESRGRPSVDAGREHWAFREVLDHPVPEVGDLAWAYDPIDRFLRAKQEAQGVRPRDDANRYQWLRRVAFDLLGVPPTPDEIADFNLDSSPDSHQRVVDRWMASPAFGQRWARHWLDLTGYADQIGTSNDVFAEHAWRYRDYVVDALNRDKPFDRFLVEQIAGDLLPYRDVEERVANLVATGFLLVGDVEIVNPDKLKMETDHIDSQLAKIGTVFMAMTLGCVRCHDHKFDPIDLEDYYGMAGTLRNTRSTLKIDNGIWSGLNVVELPETEGQQRERERQFIEHQKQLDQWADERRRLEEEQKSLADSKDKRRGEISERMRQIDSLTQHARFFSPRIPRAFVVEEEATIGDMPIAIRGNPYAPGRTIPRGVMRVAAREAASAMPRDASGRLQLAQWLASPQHPLTARVAVNRVWEKLFGEGLVRSVDYFGTRGETPSHPELLDFLAVRFVREGWSTKQLVRDLVLSHTYRMDSVSEASAAKLDPENRLLWRMHARRLDAESIRDGMLRASGELLSRSGGPALPLEYPENTGNLAPKAVNPPSFSLRRFRPEQEFVRTIYLPIVRSSQRGPGKLRDVFDFVQPAQIAGQRPQTVVATQALFLMNNELPRGRAVALARVFEAENLGRTEKIEYLWLRVLNRPPTVAEREDAVQWLGSLDPKADAWVELSHALLSSNEFLYRQ